MTLLEYRDFYRFEFISNKCGEIDYRTSILLRINSFMRYFTLYGSCSWLFNPSSPLSTILTIHVGPSKRLIRLQEMWNDAEIPRSRSSNRYLETAKDLDNHTHLDINCEPLTASSSVGGAETLDYSSSSSSSREHQPSYGLIANRQTSIVTIKYNNSNYNQQCRHTCLNLKPNQKESKNFSRYPVRPKT